MSRPLWMYLVLLLTLAACGDPSPPPEASAPDPAAQPPLDTAAFMAALPALADSATLTFPRPAPPFALPTLAGDTLRMADLRGRLVLVNFWATWCAPCIAEIPDLAALHTELHEDGLTIVGVSEDAEGFEVVAPFAEERSIPYPLVVDDGSLAQAYGGVYSLPTTFLVDADGQVVNRFVGIFPAEEMRAPLRDMLGLTVE